MNKCLLLTGLCLVSLTCLADFNQGVRAYEKADYQTALKIWKKIAEQPSTVSDNFAWHSSHSADTIKAQYGLALLYWQGKGVAQNYHEAKKWLLLAADSNHDEAQLKLAYLYLMGLDGQINTTEAIKWFEKSAQQGNVDAQYNLGALYLDGSGINKDPVIAKKWLTAAAQQGDTAAKTLLAEMNAMPAQVTAPLPVTASPQTATTPAETDSPQAADTRTVSPPATVNAQLFAAPPAVTDTAQATAPTHDYYAIQLLASAKQNDALQFMEKWRGNLNPLITTDKIKKSERIFIVAYGSYSSSAEAKQAITDLPAELKKNKPWIVKMRGEGLAP